MNGVGERCKTVLLLVGGPVALQETAAERDRGYHCACSVLLTEAADSSEEHAAACIKQRVQSFCSDNRLKVSFMEWDYISREVLGNANVLDLLTSPLTVMTCTAEDLGSLRMQLLTAGHQGDPSSDSAASPYGLLAVLDLTHQKETPLGGDSHMCHDNGGDTFHWARPTQSYVSEYGREKSDPQHMSQSQRNVLFPLHMYCVMPMIRDTGISSTAELLDGYNVCTLEGVLRELGYKAGQLPKYGA